MLISAAEAKLLTPVSASRHIGCARIIKDAQIWSLHENHNYRTFCAAAVEEAGEYLLGKDPTHIEDLWQTLYQARFYRGGPVLMSTLAGTVAEW